VVIPSRERIAVKIRFICILFVINVETVAKKRRTRLARILQRFCIHLNCAPGIRAGIRCK